MVRARRHRIKTSFGGKLFDVCNTAFIVLFCITILFPIWDLLVISFSKSEHITYMRTNMWPVEWSFESYRYCFQNATLGVAFRNSIARTIIGSVYHLFVCCLAAFALTRTDMPLRRPITVLFLVTMFFSGGLIPTYLNIKNLGLTESFWVYVLPGGFSMYNTIILRNFFFSIDKSMEESATIDGASTLKVMLFIILPLSTPVLATVGLWQMVGQWNAWFDNMIYARSESLITLQYLLRRMSSDITTLISESNQFSIITEQTTATAVTPETIIAATTVIILTPILCVYPFLQKYFVKGIMVGAVKG